MPNSVFPSVHTLEFTFCSINGRERASSIFMKTEAWTLFRISFPRRGEWDSGKIRNSWQNSTESQLQLKEWLKSYHLVHPDSPIMVVGEEESRLGPSVRAEKVAPVLKKKKKKMDWLPPPPPLSLSHTHTHTHTHTVINTWGSSCVIRMGACVGTPGHLQSQLPWESNPWDLCLGGQSLFQCSPL